MAQPLKVTVRFEDRTYHASLQGDERGDHLLLKSIHHFGIDPEEKEHFRLRFRDEERPRHGLYLDRPIGDQVRPGADLVLEERSGGNQRLSTGSY